MLQNYLSSCDSHEKLKVGGQREVYRAVHHILGQIVVKHAKCSSTLSIERLGRESKFLKELDTPCFPKLHDLVIDPSSMECLVIEEFIPGQELSESAGNYHDENSIVSLLRRLVSCLSIVWDRRVVHRDLKPANIIIRPDDSPVIIDFGIARFLDEKSLTWSMAHVGPGTPWYAAPEQLENKKQQIDARTDFFALGVICLELLLEKHPFSPELVGGETVPGNILSSKYREPSESDGASPQFQNLICRLLQRQPFLRFRDHRKLTDFLSANWGLSE